MHSVERKKLSRAEVLHLKEASMMRTLAAARDALANGTLQKRARPADVPYTMKLRVKSS